MKSVEPEGDPSEEPAIFVFADDNTFTVAHEDPNILVDLIQREGDMVTSWFSKNHILCSGEKTILLILGTKANRVNKLESSDFSPAVTINGDVIEESKSEKLLGVVINNTLTWKDHQNWDE